MSEKKTINYIEPNLINKIVDENGNVFEQTPNLEDFCIAVNIGVTLYNRKSGIKSIEGLNKTRYILNWNGYEGSVNFMRGSQIFYDETKTNSINSLTTDYADFYYDDLVNNSEKLASAEMFGIESIDINYDNYYVPQVTVKFIDIRGISLFMPEELRHNISSNDIDSSINHDIAGSFFKSFFMFPYPKFDMMIKGFYGKPITFELSIVDWRATFDCSRGSFGCTVNFIGYSYALLSDLTLNALLAAPESDYVGKKYWTNQIASGNFVYDDGTPIKTFREIISAYSTYATEKEKIEANNPKSVELQSLSAKNDLLIKLSDYFNRFTDELVLLQSKEPNNVVYDNTDSSFAYCVKDNTTTNSFVTDSLKEKAKVLNSGIYQYNIRFNGDNLPSLNLSIFIEDKKNGVKIDNTLSSSLSNKNFAKSLISKSQGYADNSYTHAYIFDANNFYFKLKNLKDKVTQDMNFTSTSLSEEYQKLSTSILGFDNTLANFMKTICAHIDTLVNMIYTCADKANNDTSRTLDKFINLSMQDVIFTNETDKYMPAFPQVGVKNVINGVDKIEMGWIEDVYSNAEEANLVKGLINGSETIAKQVTETVEIINETNGVQNTNNSASYFKYIPSLPIDIINNNRFLGNSNLNWNLLDDVFARIMMRGFIASYTFPNENKTSNLLSAIGAIDAINFDKSNPNPSATFIDLIVNNNAINEFINYKNYESKTYSWGDKPLLVKENNRYVIAYNEFFNEDNNMLLIFNKNYDYQSLITSKVNENVFNDTKNNIVYKREDAIQENEENIYALNIITNDVDEKYNQWMEMLPSDNSFNGISELKDCYTIVNFDVNDYNDEFDIENVREKAQKLETNDTWFIFTKHPSSVFGDYRYYNIGDDFEQKAYFFLNSIYTDKSDECVKFLSQDKTFLYIMPKLLMIYVGAQIKYAENPYFKYINKFAKNTLEKEFEKWVNDENIGFKRISRELELTEFDIEQLKTAKNKTLVKYSEHRQKIYKPTPYSDTTLGNEFQVRLQIKDDADILSVIMNLMSERVLMIKSIRYNVDTINKFGDSEHEIGNVLKSVQANLLEKYLSGFYNYLKFLYKEKQNNNTLSLSTVNDPQTNKHLYISLYNYLKLTYDRWLGGKDNNERSIWMLNDFYQRFHFIDSFYFKIGNDIRIDIEHMVNLIDNSLRQDTMSLVEFINTVLAHQNMLFLSIQNFLDLSKKENIETMFKPVTYDSIGNVIPQTDFVCIYTYKASNNLNIEGSEYQDDSFLLSDPNIGETMPFLVVNDKDTGYDIPCFGVTYGKQYQSYFTSVNPTMENPVITEQVIKSQFLLANSAPNGSSKELFVGQDLYTIYSNNSYSCTVEMLGCAWIQPLMYFALLNIPMFKGSYLIHKVSHSIQQGMMKTTFVGTRMCKICTPLITDKIISLRNDENGSFQRQRVMNNNQAAIDNNCPYPKFEPLSNSLDGYANAIQESCKATPSIDSEVIIENSSINAYALNITDDNKDKLAIVYDMLLYTYYSQIQCLYWVINNENELKSNPSEIYIEFNTSGYCTVKRKIAIVKKNNFTNMMKLSYTDVSDSFLKSLAKSYQDERQFITDCYNFKHDKTTYQKIKSLYKFNCDSMNLNDDEISNIQRRRNMGQANTYSLPNSICFPISGITGCNISGYFGEPRSNHTHMGVDIGVSGNSYDMLAIYDGVVVSVQKNPKDYGEIIVIRHSIRDNDGKYLYARYLHGRATVETNAVVVSGGKIGAVDGLTGYPKHLHLEFSFFDGDYSYDKFKKNLVDPQAYYYFGIYHKPIDVNVVDNGYIRKMGTNNTPSYIDVHPNASWN